MTTATKAKSKTTTNHDEIKEWAEKRGGKPSVVKGTENSEKGGGLLRINFPGFKEENLKDISWEEFFAIFDDRQLQFLYQETTADGKESRFFKLIA